jgi:hypothetical protein
VYQAITGHCAQQVLEAQRAWLESNPANARQTIDSVRAEGV